MVEDSIRDQIAEYKRQQEQAQKQVIALSGAIQALEALLEELGKSQ